MCWTEKLCYIVPANLGCVFIGVCSFILSTVMMVTSITCYILEAKAEKERPAPPKTHFELVLGLEMNMSSVHIILTTITIVAILWMVFSIMLVVGIMKNKSYFILSYFTFGIILTILCQLAALLLLLQNCWIIAIILFIVFLVHIHFLVVVHTVYELMQRGKVFGFYKHQNQDEDPLADSFDGVDIDRT